MTILNCLMGQNISKRSIVLNKQCRLSQYFIWKGAIYICPVFDCVQSATLVFGLLKKDCSPWQTQKSRCNPWKCFLYHRNPCWGLSLRYCLLHKRKRSAGCVQQDKIWDPWLVEFLWLQQVTTCSSSRKGLSEQSIGCRGLLIVFHQPWSHMRLMWTWMIEWLKRLNLLLLKAWHFFTRQNQLQLFVFQLVPLKIHHPHRHPHDCCPDLIIAF